MPRSKEIQEPIRHKVIDMHQSGKGYKTISKALGLQRTTVRAIIYKWRKLGIVVNLPRSGRPTKISQRQRQLMQEVIKEPRTTSKEQQDSLASVKDGKSESLLPAEICKEPQSPPTSAELLSLTSLAHFKVILVKAEDEDQGCSPEQKLPVYSPVQHTAGPSIPQQGSPGLLPSPDLSKSCSVTGPPPCTGTATFPGPPETICVPTLSSSPFPSPVSHSSPSSIDSVSFWKCCNAAGCTQAIFADFINEMNNISSRIQSNQASQEDYDLAFKLLADSGKLAELLVIPH